MREAMTAILGRFRLPAVAKITFSLAYSKKAGWSDMSDGQDARNFCYRREPKATEDGIHSFTHKEVGQTSHNFARVSVF